MAHKAGFVNILGAPNVGKSTLMNVLIGEKFSIVTPKAQTTRHRIKGIVNGPDFQIIFTDTPGILKPAYMLHQSMMKFVTGSIQDGDVFLYLVEPGQKELNQDVVNKILNTKKTFLLLINKVDLTDQQGLEKDVAFWSEQLPAAEILPVSALHHFSTDVLLKKIIASLPESEPYYPKDEMTDLPERFFVSEIIREKIFTHYQKEVPYCTEVEIQSFKEETDIIRISATIHVMRESQKAIMLGHKGEAIKRLGMLSRRELEKYLNKHVFLELRIKVSKDWRNDANSLKKFGYE